MSRLLAVVVTLLVLAVPILANDWPAWRGPDRTAVSKETGLLKTWPEGGPKLVWQTNKAGRGYAGLAVVNGLLHTESYARSSHEGAMPRLDPHQIDRQIEAKLTRQRILTRADPPRFHVVLDEAALHRMVGGRQVMAAQLAKILDVAALPNTVVQVLPYDRGAHPAVESNFTILELPAPAPGAVFVEGLIGSVLLERSDDLERYQAIFNRLQSIALNPQETADLIAKYQLDYLHG